MRLVRVAVPVLLSVALLVGCSSGSTPAPKSGSASVTIQNFAYHPQVLTVTAGTTVTWTNQDTVQHTVTADAGSGGFSSALLSQGQTFRHTFTRPGTYQYYCEVHTSMRGTIIVK